MTDNTSLYDWFCCEGSPWCAETLDAPDGVLTCEISGPHASDQHAGDRHEAVSGETLYSWYAGIRVYTAEPIPLPADEDDEDRSAMPDHERAYSHRTEAP